MPVGFYVIPMVAGPYSRTNPQRPDYVDEIQCNWTGHNVDDLGVYVCKVNTTDAKHIDLDSRVGVRSLPRTLSWDTVMSTMTGPQQTAVSNWCSSKSIPFDSSETVGQFLMRVICSGLFSLGNAALSTLYQNLTQTQRDKITAICQRHSAALPAGNETVRQIVNRLGLRIWPGNDSRVVNVGEF